MEPVTFLEPVICAADMANKAEAGDYQKDGLLYCGKCHTPKQTRQRIMGRVFMAGCMCACACEAYNREQEARHQQEEADRIMRLRCSGITSQEYRHASFSLDDGKNPDVMAKLRDYAERWDDMRADSIGLLLYGGVGTGKSYGAACIANYLIERNVPACMVNLSTVMNAIWGFQGKEKNEYIANLMQYPLLILDDFGMERQTEYALEQVFNVVDARCQSGKPLIITTNLPYSTFKDNPPLDRSRIYSRIREMCMPVYFGNSDRRKDIAQAKMRRAAEILRDR